MTSTSAFPKLCACGRSWTSATWATLLYVGVMGESPDDIEIRQCVCGSSIAVDRATIVAVTKKR